MAAVAQATHLTHISFITSNTPPPEGKVCTTGDNYVFKSRVGESLQEGIAHKPCKTGLSVPAIKTDSVYKTGETKMKPFAEVYAMNDKGVYSRVEKVETDDNYPDLLIYAGDVK